jgi:hypothetical protein
VDRIGLHKELFNEVRKSFKIEKIQRTTRDNGKGCHNMNYKLARGYYNTN